MRQTTEHISGPGPDAEGAGSIEAIEPVALDLVEGACAQLVAEGSLASTCAAAADCAPSIVRCGSDGVWRAWRLLPSRARLAGFAARDATAVA